jgi:hypothetical protein
MDFDFGEVNRKNGFRLLASSTYTKNDIASIFF